MHMHTHTDHAQMQPLQSAAPLDWAAWHCTGRACCEIRGEAPQAGAALVAGPREAWSRRNQIFSGDNFQPHIHRNEHATVGGFNTLPCLWICNRIRHPL